MYYIQATHQNGSVLAKVNGIKITQRQVNRAVQQLKSSFTQPGQVLSAEQQQQLQDIALSRLITSAALVNRAKKQGFYVSKAQVNALVTEIPAFQVNGSFSPQRFKQVLYASGLTQDSLMEQMRRDFLVTQAQVGMTSSDFILPNELENGFMLMHQRRDFGFFILSPKDFISSIKTTRENLIHYYHSHQDAFKVPEKASFQYVTLSPKLLESQVVISEEEAKQYYEDNKENYYTPAKRQIQEIILQSSKQNIQSKQGLEEKATEIVKALQNGVPFDALLKKYQGKTLWVESGQIESSLDRVLSQMQIGQISKPVEMQSSIAIVKLLAVEKAQLKPYSEVMHQVKTSLKDQKVQDLFSRKSEELSNLTYANASTLKPAATALGLTIHQTGVTENNDSAKGVLTDKKIRDVAFNAAVLTEGNNSNPVMLKNGDIIVLRVNKYEAAHVPVFSTIIDQVKKNYVNQQSRQAALQRANALTEDLSKGVSLASLAKKYQLTFQERSGVSMDTKNLDRNILSTVFQLPLPAADSQKQSVQMTQLLNGDFAVIILRRIQLPKKLNLSDTQKTKLKQSLLNMNQSLSYQLYVYGARQMAKIKESKK